MLGQISELVYASFRVTRKRANAHAHKHPITNGKATYAKSYATIVIGKAKINWYQPVTKQLVSDEIRGTELSHHGIPESHHC